MSSNTTSKQIRTVEQRVANRLMGDVYRLDEDQAAHVAAAAVKAWNGYDPAQHEGRPGSRRYTVTTALNRAVRDVIGHAWREEVIDDIFDLVHISFAEHAAARQYGLRS